MAKKIYVEEDNSLAAFFTDLNEKLYNAKNKGAVEGEVCAWCKTPMNPGAFACSGCHAERKVKAEKSFLGFIFAVLLAVSILGCCISILYVIFGDVKGISWLYVAIPFVTAFLGWYKVPVSAYYEKPTTVKI